MFVYGKVTAHVCLNMLTYGFSVMKLLMLSFGHFGTAQGQLVSQQYIAF